MNIEKNIEILEEKILDNLNRIENNSEKIHRNTGALEILKTFKADTNKFFIMWLITFFAFLSLLWYVIYLSNDINRIETQQVEQDTKDGSNFYVGRDVNGETSSNNN
jgi:hypothetical protein